MAEEDAEGCVEPTLLQTLRAHGGEVTCCDVAPGGGALASGGGDRALRAWRWERGAGWREHGAVRDAHRYGVTAVRWAPGGALLASGGVDGAVRAWELRELRARGVLAAPGAAAVRALAWLGSGVLAAGHDDGAARLWRLRGGALLARLQAHDGALHALAAPAAGALLLTACTEGVLKVFDTFDVIHGGDVKEAGGVAPLVWEDGAHDLGVLCADASACGRWAATGGHDGRARVWAAGGGGTLRPHAQLAGHGAGVTALRWAGAGRRARLLTGALDRTARLWTPAGACLCVLPAHARYLTCVALAPDLAYMITGSNDKTLRMWALGSLSLSDDVVPPCSPIAHFGVGDLEGIGAVDDDELMAMECAVGNGEGEGEGGARCVWTRDCGTAVNCVAASGDLLAAACSDGIVRVFRRTGEDGFEEWHVLEGHEYPVLAVAFGARGALLLSGGLDGVARLWDVETGVQLRALQPPAAGETDTGGGGVRACCVSATRPPLLLLATDDGTAPLWSLADAEPAPLHVYGGHAEAATSCAVSACGRLLATGGAAGELRVHRAPPAPATLHHQHDAHDLGVTSCDFAPAEWGGAADTRLLATAGGDSFIRLWLLHYDEEEETLRMECAVSVAAGGGGAVAARWGAGGLLASAGAERWARVWRVHAGAAPLRAQPLAAAPVPTAGGATAALLLDSGELVVGALVGELALWRLSVGAEDGGAGADADAGEDADVDDESDLAPRFWSVIGVTRWLQDYVTHVPGQETGAAGEGVLARVRVEGVAGAALLDAPLPLLLGQLGLESDDELEMEVIDIRTRFIDEVQWLRREPLTPEQATLLPHWLRCPLSHATLRSPARAADGVTYERAALREWFLAAGTLRSGRALHGLRAAALAARNLYCMDTVRTQEVTDIAVRIRKILEWGPRTFEHSVGLVAVAGCGWMGKAEDHECWHMLAKTYVRQWTSTGECPDAGSVPSLNRDADALGKKTASSRVSCFLGDEMSLYIERVPELQGPSVSTPNGGPVSAVSGRRLHNARVLPNRAARAQLRVLSPPAPLPTPPAAPGSPAATGRPGSPAAGAAAAM